MISIEEREKIFKLVKEIAIYFEKTKNKLSESYGISSPQSLVLLDVYHHPNAKVTDICKRLGKETNTISPLINRLIKNGLLEKTISLEDHRVATINLSIKGKEVIKNFLNKASEYTWPIFDKITDEEFSQIYNSLQLLEQIIQED